MRGHYRSGKYCAQMVGDVVDVWTLLGLTGLRAKTAAMCLIKCMDRVTFVTEAPGQVYKQTRRVTSSHTERCLP